MSEQYTSEENIYASPDADLVHKDAENLESQAHFFTVSRKKLVIMSIATLNLYLIYWFFKNWMLQKRNANFSCIPILRAIFSIFFTHSLFTQIDETLRINKSKNHVNGGMASLYVLVTIGFIFINKWEPNAGDVALYAVSFIGMVVAQFVPFWYVQPLINEINQDPQGLENNQLTLLNWVFILLGVAYWALLIIGVVAIAYL